MATALKSALCRTSRLVSGNGAQFTYSISLGGREQLPTGNGSLRIAPASAIAARLPQHMVNSPFPAGLSSQSRHILLKTPVSLEATE